MVYHEALMAYSDWGYLLLRVALASVFLYHGWPKVFSTRKMSKSMGKSVQFVLLLGLIETLSSISVLFGIYPYIGALGMIFVMLGALYYKIFRWKVPFAAMNKTGWEFDLVLLAGAVMLLLGTYGFVLF